MKKLLRKPFRIVLSYLTKLTLEKHKPTVISILGDGQTSIAREMVYEVIATSYPVRRNLESPESEFSVPLTILGYPTYPKTIIDWLKMVGKTVVQIFKIKPYKHFLVLELNAVDKNILDYWINITTSETVLVVGNFSIDYEKYNFKKIIKISSNGLNDLLGPYKIACRQIARYYELDANKVDSLLSNFSLPLSKIRYLPGANWSFVIDATHYYLPTSLEAVLEIENSQESEENKVIYTTLSEDISFLKTHSEYSSWQINPTSFTPINNDIIILRGDRVKQNQKYQYLINSKIPLI